MRLREIRIMKNISQKELGEKLNLADTTISSYERGLCDPSLENLIKMADILDVSVDTLLGHDANLIDLNVLSDNQKQVVNIVTKELEETEVAKVLGYIDNLKSK